MVKAKLRVFGFTAPEYAIIPALLPDEERQREFTSNDGLILDPLKEFNDRRFLLLAVFIFFPYLSQINGFARNSPTLSLQEVPKHVD